MIAAARCSPSPRARSRYHPAAVAARFSATSSANETPTPKIAVTGAMTTPCRMCEALLIRFTPSGAFRRSVTRPKSPVQNSTPWARNHSIRAWSATFAAIARVAGSGQSPLVSQKANHVYPSPTAASRTPGFAHLATNQRHAWPGRLPSARSVAWSGRGVRSGAAPPGVAAASTSSAIGRRDVLVTAATLSLIGARRDTAGWAQAKACARISPGRVTVGAAARMVEPADTAALKAAAERRAGSSPAPGTCGRYAMSVL